ncbi:MAG: hypothetical protein IPI04_03845 [Ignavibacteria bacterium]|nr:hypothetical protein [Ignavibacteria bacterium]
MTIVYFSIHTFDQIKRKGVIMFYNKINNPKKKIYRVILNCFLILAYLNSFNSCAAPGMYTESPDSFEPGRTSNIKTIELKNGTIIDCTGKIIWIIKESESSVAFVIAADNKIKTQDSSGQNATKLKDTRISQKDVKAVTFDNTEVDSNVVGFGAVGVLVTLGIIIGLSALMSSATKDLTKK